MKKKKDKKNNIILNIGTLNMKQEQRRNWNKDWQRGEETASLALV